MYEIKKLIETFIFIGTLLLNSQFIIFTGAIVAIEGVQLHSPYFAKLWYEIYHSEVSYHSILFENIHS